MCGLLSGWTVTLFAPAADEGLDEVVGGRGHQVGVEGDLGVFAHAGDDGRTEGEVGDEVAVHDVQVEEVGAGVLDVADFGGESGEVGGEEGGGDPDFLHVWSVYLRAAGGKFN